MQQVAYSTLLMGGLGVALTLLLYTVVRWQNANGDSGEKVELLTNLLPGNNCGACGHAGCSAMARAMEKNETLPHQCPVATAEQVSKLQEVLGHEDNAAVTPKVARVQCGGTEAVAKDRAAYAGVLDCRAADITGKGTKACTYGCLGLGTCASVCPFDAIAMGDDGLPIVDEGRCTGCGICVTACPRGVMRLFDTSQTVFVKCVATALGKQVRAVCQVGCIACSICVRKCEHGTIQMVNNLAVIDPTTCTQCGDCVEDCPTGTIIDLVAAAEASARNGYAGTKVRESAVV